MAEVLPGPTVLVVDDHMMVRREIGRLVEQAGGSVVGEAATAADAAHQASALQPDLVILDLDLPDASGLSIIARLQEDSPASRIVVLSASNAESDIRRALAAGAHGYLTKDESGAAVISAISNASAGVMVVTPMAMSTLLEGVSQNVSSARERVLRLSSREVEVLRLLADGLSAAEIGGVLGISIRTVEGHTRSISGRLGARNRAEAVRIYVEARLPGLGPSEVT